jgi:hypothetical protein
MNKQEDITRNHNSTIYLFIYLFIFFFLFIYLRGAALSIRIIVTWDYQS